MSNHLPDVLDDWPLDPFELLGVDADADSKTIRKAYVRLIRKYKPEQHPAEFQRIRVAYEEATGTGDGLDAGFGSFRSDATVSSPASASESTYTKEANAAWQLAKKGAFAEAISKLEAILSAQPDDEHVLCRLFWVRKLDPSTTEEAIFAWLCRVASRSVDSSHVWDLLAVESSTSRPDLLSGDFADLLGTNAALPHLNWLLRRRWSEAMHQQAWHQIATDVQGIGKSHSPAHTNTACMAALFSLQFLLWADSKKQVEFERVLQCIGEWKKWLSPAEHDEVLALVACREQWLKCRRLPDVVVRVMRESLTAGDDDGFRRTRLDLLKQFARSPKKWLKWLDKLELNHPFVMGWLCRSMRADMPLELGSERHAVLDALIDKFFWGNSAKEYTQSRLNFVHFCLQQGVQLHQVAEKILVKQEENESKIKHLHQPSVERFAELVMVDRPLQCLYFGIAELQMMTP